MRDLIKIIEMASRYATPTPDFMQREATPVGQVLFHGTPLLHALQIIKDNDISTGANWRGEGDRVALTRSFAVANEFGTHGDYEEYPVVFVLDWPKLSRDYRIVPHNDVDSEGNHFPNFASEDGTEQEEAVYGHIKPLSKYLVSNIPQDVLERALTDTDHGQYGIEEKGWWRTQRGYRGDVARLLRHPKLNVWRKA